MGREGERQDDCCLLGQVTQIREAEMTRGERLIFLHNKAKRGTAVETRGAKELGWCSEGEVGSARKREKTGLVTTQIY